MSLTIISEQINKPSWLKIRPASSEKYYEIRELHKKLNLHSVCIEANCPNASECWSTGTATFMIMGDTCTRACKFCNVKTSLNPPAPLDKNEPKNLAKAISKLNLGYIVITSVDRDDLKDQGAEHFAECIKELKKIPGLKVEVLTPDFQGKKELIEIVVEAEPDVFGHNLETVERLQKKVRDLKAGYEQSLKVLNYVKKINPEIYTKSSLMLGLGETKEEVIQSMKDLRKIKVDVLTLGQYLRPSKKHLPVKEYVLPEQFKEYEKIGKELGFKYIASGPFVRSSYKAAELFLKKK